MDTHEQLPTDLISTGQAVKLVPGQRPGKSIHLATVYRWILDGRLRSWKVGGRLLVSEAELRALFRPVPARRRPSGENETAAERVTRQQADAHTRAALKRHGLL